MHTASLGGWRWRVAPSSSSSTPPLAQAVFNLRFKLSAHCQCQWHAQCHASAVHTVTAIMLTGILVEDGLGVDAFTDSEYLSSAGTAALATLRLQPQTANSCQPQ